MSSYDAYEAWAAQQGHRSPPYRPTLAYRLAPLPFVVLGALGLFMYVFPTSEQVPESQLTLVEGVPSDVEFGKHIRRYGSVEKLSFVVGGYKTYISAYHPKYESVRSAVQERSPLKVWLETKRKYSGDDSKPLYKLTAGSRTLVAYGDTIEQQSEQHNSSLVVGIALLIAGAFVAVLGAFQQRRYDAYVAMLHQAQPVA